MKHCSKVLVAVIGALVLTAGAATAQINPTPYFTNFYDTLYSSTFNGEPLPVGSVIQAYDPDSVLCGMFTVTTAGTYGFMPVYGDDLTNTPGLDEGATDDDSISFKINGRDATVVSGDPIWTNQAFRNVVLDVSAPNTMIAVTAISKPGLTLVAPRDTASLILRVRNDGNGLDYYGMEISMSQPSGPDIQNDWEAIIPDTLVYANSGETIDFEFRVRAPVWPGDTLNVVRYKLYSYLDTTVTVEDSVYIYDTVTDIGDPDNPGLPGSFTLNQNYPNPFNPTTTIAFSLPEHSSVVLDVYDVLGRHVEQRQLGDLSAGDHSVEFDGSSLASGVYFYRLTSESATQTRKMMLLK